jgi:zinc/manganese transport system substrate-binding protein/manganese/iron transport system substrate-binding protein
MTTRSPFLAAIAAGLIAAVSLVSGCGNNAAAPATGGTLKVVATTTQIADFARNIGGDKVRVTQILKPNVDPHDYEPTPADITEIGGAKVVLRNGVGLDAWLDQTITAAGFTGQVVDLSKGITIRPGLDEAEKEGDPHIWQNPRNAKTMSATIEAGLAAADAGNAAYYQQNLATYQAKLDRLDADIETKINTIPVAQRTLVTNHDAFGYYIDRYQLKFVGSIIPSFDTSAELSGTDLQDLVAKIKSTGVKAIFSESSLPPKTAETIAQEAGVKVEAGEDSLYADTLGPDGSSGATYIDALTHNTDVIVTALRG